MINTWPTYFEINNTMFEPNFTAFIDIGGVCPQVKKKYWHKFDERKCILEFDWKSIAPSRGHFSQLATKPAD